MNTLDVLGKILDLNPGIQELNFVELKESRLLQQSMEATAKEKKQIELAMDIRARYHFTFWDCLCSTFINNRGYSKRLLGCIFHHNYNDDVISIPRGQYSHIDQHLDGEKKYAILSRVIFVDRQVYHLPLIDFHCNSTGENVQLAEDLIGIMEIGPGYLLDSGESFHFIGTQLISAMEFGPYLGKLIMYSPIIDKSWIAHQLVEGSCALRVTQKKEVLPTVIKGIGI